MKGGRYWGKSAVTRGVGDDTADGCRWRDVGDEALVTLI